MSPRVRTLAWAKAEATKVGCTLRVRDGEYRVNLRGGKEATAYYTTDIEDAVLTAQAMRRQEEQRLRAEVRELVAPKPLRLCEARLVADGKYAGGADTALMQQALLVLRAEGTGNTGQDAPRTLRLAQNLSVRMGAR